MITEPLFYLVAVPAVILVGLSKGGLAGALAMLGVPMMSLAVPPIQAAGILLPILIAMDVFALWAYRHEWDVRNLLIMVPAAVVGIAVGWLTAEQVSDAHVRLIVGLVALGFTLSYWLGWPRQGQTQANTVRGGAWGMLAGFTSFVSHAGGPPVQIYLLPQRMSPRLYVGTSVVFFWIVNWIKVVPYAMLGQLGSTNLMTSLVLAPLAPLSIFAAVKLIDRIESNAYYAITYFLLFVISLKLIWDGVTTVFGF
jgi:hypothetical protein